MAGASEIADHSVMCATVPTVPGLFNKLFSRIQPGVNVMDRGES